MPDTNPLLQAWDLPPWSEVRTEPLVPAITAIITDNRQVIAETILSQSLLPNWDDLVLAIDEIDARLSEALEYGHGRDPGAAAFGHERGQ